MHEAFPFFVKKIIKNIFLKDKKIKCKRICPKFRHIMFLFSENKTNRYEKILLDSKKCYAFTENAYKILGKSMDKHFE